MRLPSSSGAVVLRGRAQWLRCGFDHAALLDDVVALPMLDPTEQSGPGTSPTLGPAGLAFDRSCRLLHSLPEQSRIEYVLWSDADPFSAAPSAPVDFLVRPEGSELEPPILRSAVALACDTAGYLYLADRDTPTVTLVDLSTGRIARTLDLPGKAVDLAACGDAVYVLMNDPDGWGVLRACGDFESLSWPASLGAASRLDCAGDPQRGGRAFVLLKAGQEAAALVDIGAPAVPFPLPHCSDFVISAQANGSAFRVVCARWAGEDFRVLRLTRGFEDATFLSAPQYDGRGIALAPNDRVAFFTPFGVGYAAPARITYASTEPAYVFGYALDSERDQSTWGALTVEACIPTGTSIQVYAFTRDDLDFGDARVRTPPAAEQLQQIAEPEATPLPSQAAWQERAPRGQTLFRMSAPQLLGDAAPQGFARYDAAVLAKPGRYLWLVFELIGTRHRSPRLRSARVAYPGHELLSLLPRTLWRDEAARSFLFRYLTPLADLLAVWGATSDARQRLIDPCTTPAAALDWLASFVALGMDPCWPEAARRQMLREAADLFRGRGTLWSLRRMLEILTGAEVVIIERFRLRGGGVVDNPLVTQASSVVGAGLRVGGGIGDQDGDSPVTLGGVEDDEWAHRFNVTLVGSLSEEQLRCAERLVETHKPAHTAFDLCTADRGVRVGVGLHVGVAAVIGSSGGFDPITLGDAVLGKGYALGRPPIDDANSTGGSP